MGWIITIYIGSTCNAEYAITWFSQAATISNTTTGQSIQLEPNDKIWSYWYSTEPVNITPILKEGSNTIKCTIKTYTQAAGNSIGTSTLYIIQP